MSKAEKMESEGPVSVSEIGLSEAMYQNIGSANRMAMKNLEGRLLTFVDAAFSDVVQREAFKDNIRGILERTRMSQGDWTDEICAELYLALQEKRPQESGKKEEDPWFVKRLGDRVRAVPEYWVDLKGDSPKIILNE